MLIAAGIDELVQRWVAWATSRDGRAHDRGLLELEALDGRAWVQVDEAARGRSGGHPLVTGARGWLGPQVGAPGPFVAAVTSLHTDGRIRQRAVRALAHHHGAVAAGALALRAVDHVEAVRADALPALLGRSSAAEAHAAVGVLLATGSRQHTGGVLSAYGAALLASSARGAALAALCSRPDAAVQRWAWTLRLREDVLTEDEVLTVADTHLDPLVRSLFAERAATTVASAGLRRLLASRHVEGRVAALTRLPDADLSDDALRAALLDRSPRGRLQAQWRARRRGIDPTEVYRRHLAVARHHPDHLVQASSTAPPLAAGTPRLVSTCLLELAHAPASSTQPTRPQGGDLWGYLHHDSPAVRAAAVTATAALAGSGAALAHLTPLLLDPAARVAATAARHLVLLGAPVASLGQAWASAQPWSRRAAWQAQRRTSTWDRVEADLRALADPDAHLAALAGSDLRSWLDHHAANAWNPPSTGQRTRISDRLARSGLPNATRRVLAFHADIPWT